MSTIFTNCKEKFKIDAYLYEKLARTLNFVPFMTMTGERTTHPHSENPPAIRAKVFRIKNKSYKRQEQPDDCLILSDAVARRETGPLPNSVSA